MKNCIACVNVLTDDATHCHACNTDQTITADKVETGTGYNDIFLKVLCWLTIAGAVFGLVSIPVALAVPDLKIEISWSFIAISMIVAVAKLTAAIFMLKKKLAGLYIYTVASIVGIGHGIYLVAIADTKNMATFSSNFFSLGALIIFLVMYWLPINKKLLS